MIFLDSNIVIDLIEATGPWSGWSRERVAEARSDGLVGGPILIAEVAGHFTSFDDQLAYLADLKVVIRDLTAVAGRRAGRAHRAYRNAGGTRRAVLADFLIGGHAATLGTTLLTRDRQRFSAYFPDLTLITPETHP